MFSSTALATSMSGDIDLAAAAATLRRAEAARAGMFRHPVIPPCPEGQAVTLRDGVRFYNIAGSMLPSVTSILGAVAKPGLVKWSARTAEERVIAAVKRAASSLQDEDGGASMLVSRTFRELGRLRQEEQASDPAELGTTTHKAIEYLSRVMDGQKDLGPEPETPEAALPAVVAWKRWAADVSYRPVFIERLVYCVEPSCQYAGSLDALGWVEGVPTLLDWKRGPARASYKLQLAAYAHAVERTTGIRPERAMIVSLPRDEGAAEPTHITRDELTSLLDTVRNVRAVFAWDRENP